MPILTFRVLHKQFSPFEKIKRLIRKSASEILASLFSGMLGGRIERTQSIYSSQLLNQLIFLLSKPEVDYLKTLRLARIATVNDKDQPDVVPVGFEFDREYFWVGSHD
jgi:hypothetical protein